MSRSRWHKERLFDVIYVRARPSLDSERQMQTLYLEAYESLPNSERKGNITRPKPLLFDRLEFTHEH